MIGILLKKQLTEIFRSYFYDAKKNRARSRGTTIGFIVLFVVLMVGVLGGVFTALSLLLCQSMASMSLGWLYFLLLTLVAVFLGVFGSVFNTFSGLYQAKDNDLLLSMPVPVRAILVSRLLGVYLMGLMYSGVVLLPAVVVYWVTASCTVGTVLGGLSLLLAVSLLVLVLSCLMGWVVAKLSTKLKHKNILTALAVVVFIVAYYAVCFRLSDIMEELLAHLDDIASAVRTSAYALYLLGRMGEGDWLAIAAVLAVTLALCALTYWLLSRTFLTIATSQTAVHRTRARREEAVKGRSVSAALLGRELSRFFASTNYMLNCGLGTLLLPLLGVVLLVKGDQILPVFSAMWSAQWPDAAAILLCAAVCMVVSMNDMTASAISLDGNTLWLSQSLPVSPWQVLRAKLSAQMVLTAVPGAFCSVCIVVLLHPSWLTAVLLVVLPAVFAALSGAFGLLLDLKQPTLTWTSEVAVVKQRLIVLIAMMGGWVYAAAMGGLYLPICGWINAELYLLAWLLVTAAGAVLLRRYIRIQGAKRFAAL